MNPPIRSSNDRHASIAISIQTLAYYTGILRLPYTHKQPFLLTPQREPYPPLEEYATRTGRYDDPGPAVRGLLGSRPEAVLLLAVLLELAQLDRVIRRVPALLARLGLAVAAHQSQERVVGGRADQGEGVQETRAEEEGWEGEVH